MPKAARHQGDTFGRARNTPRAQASSVLVASIAWHPDLARIGEHAILPERGEVMVSRLELAFGAGAGGEDRPLDDPFVSRKSIAITSLANGAIELSNPTGASARCLDRALGVEPLRIAAPDLERGVMLELGGRVLVWIERRARAPEAIETYGIAGKSSAIEAVRAEISRRAETPASMVLVRGETGTGKELVARALHALGPRKRAPFVAVNVAAIPATTAAAALFGHIRGAFTGAADASPGYFGRADGGVLFLDEIGELAGEIQPMLLRALESGEIQPVGAATPVHVDCAVIAATDARLEELVESGRFRAPLYHRLSAAVIELPPLRERGIDPLILFARAVLAADPPPSLADATMEASPMIGPSLAGAVLAHSWPGNVRELTTFARKLVDRARRGEPVEIPELRSTEPPAAAIPATRATELSDDQIRESLREHGFRLAAAAAALGISRTYLDQRIAKSELVRKAKDLQAAEIRAALDAHAGDLDEAAASLEVSPRGLRLRMTQLGIS